MEIMQTKNDTTIRYQRVSLTGFYLQCAHKSAKSSIAISDGPEEIELRIEQAILTILWSTLALEAGANEIAESVISSTDLMDFEMCRKEYKKQDKHISSIIWKWHLLFKLGPKIIVPFSDPIFAESEALVQIRHLLTHYKPKETSRKVYYQLSPPVMREDGMFYRVAWDENMKPSKIEPSFVERELLSKPPKQFFMAAREVFLQWELKNGLDGTRLNKKIPAL